MTKEELLKHVAGNGHCIHNPLMVCSECSKWFDVYSKAQYEKGYDDGMKDANMQENSVFSRFN